MSIRNVKPFECPFNLCVFYFPSIIPWFGRRVSLKAVLHSMSSLLLCHPWCDTRVFLFSSQCHDTCLLQYSAFGSQGVRKTSLPSRVLLDVGCTWQLLPLFYIFPVNPLIEFQKCIVSLPSSRPWLTSSRTQQGHCLTQTSLLGIPLTYCL